MSEDIPFELTDGACCPECGTKMVPCTHSAAESEPWWCAECGFNEPVDAQAPASGEVERILIQAMAEIENCAWGIPGYDTAEEAATWMNERATKALSEACQQHNSENGPTLMGEPVRTGRNEEQRPIGYTNASQLFYLSEEEGEATIFAKKEEAGDIPVFAHPPAKVPEGLAGELKRAVHELYPLDTWQIVKASREELIRYNHLRNLVVSNLELLITPTPATTPEAEWAKDVIAERKRQDEKWGGPKHDDQKSPNDFVQHIEDYAGWARVMAGMGSFEKYRRRMIQVAALAGAAVEASDRAIARAAKPAQAQGGEGDE